MNEREQDLVIDWDLYMNSEARMAAFREARPDRRWPPLIVQLAERIASGEDCRQQLHDAWEERGWRLPSWYIPILECAMGAGVDSPIQSWVILTILKTDWWVDNPAERKWVGECFGEEY